MPEYIVIFLLFFLGFVFIPSGTSLPFELPKIILAEVGIWLLFLWQFSKNGGLKLKNINQVQIVLFLLIFILTIFDLIFNATTINFFGNIFRLQGIFLLWQLMLFAFLASKVNIFKKPHIAEIAFVSLLMMLVSSLAMGPNEAGRLMGTLGEPNALAAVAVFLLPFTIFSKNKSIKILGFIASGIIIIISGSRSGFIAMALESVLLLLVLKRKFSMGKTFLVCILLLLFTYLFPFTGNGTPYENRSEIWTTALASGLEKPISGHGFGNIEIALNNTSKRLLNNNIQYQYVDSSHNLFLDWWVEGGLIGLALLIALLANTAYVFIKKKALLHLMLLMGLLAVLSFNPASIVTLIAFWWTLGQGFGILTA